MACKITKGRTEPCKNSIGGLRMAYFINYVQDAFTISNGKATAISAEVDAVYPFELRSDSNILAESLVSDRNTGTTVNTQTLTLALKKQDSDTALEVNLMAYGHPIVVVQDANGEYRVVGLKDGLDLTASDITTGGARADFNGYNLTFTGQEEALAPYLDAPTILALKALIPSEDEEEPEVPET